MKRINACIGGIVIALALALTACEGPTGPQGDPGPDINIEITIEGGGTGSEDIEGVITQALTGISGAGPYNITVKGVNVGNDAAVKNLIYGIVAGLDEAGLTGDIKLTFYYNSGNSADPENCKGAMWGYVSGIPDESKARYIEITLPDTVKTITSGVSGAGAFTGWSKLETVNAPAVTTVGAYAFQSCTSLQTVNFSAAATSVGNYAFYVASGAVNSLASISLPAATSIGNYAFQYRTALATVTAASVQTVGFYAFSDCTGLTSVTLTNAQTIGSSTFYGCTGLTSVNLSSVQSIGQYAFRSTGPTALTVTMGAVPPTLEIGMFTGVSSPGKSVTVKRPSGSTAAYGASPGNTTDDIWGNGFRGRGWNGTNCINDSNYANGYVTLTIQDS
jgi:hypothetical protein